MVFTIGGEAWGEAFQNVRLPDLMPIVNDEKLCLEFCMFYNLLAKSHVCARCQSNCKPKFEGRTRNPVWKCTKKNCRVQCSMRTDTFFGFKSKLPLKVR